LHLLHFTAWKKGLKGAYYARSKSVQRADKVSIKAVSSAVQLEMKLPPVVNTHQSEGSSDNNNYDECLACQ
jgi:ribonucleoside-diphosphate reductase alpha chain